MAEIRIGFAMARELAEGGWQTLIRQGDTIVITGIPSWFDGELKLPFITAVPSGNCTPNSRSEENDRG